MAYEPTGKGPDPTVKEEIKGFGSDLKREVTSEAHEMDATRNLVDPNQTDELVQKHVTGLSISLFVIIALILLAAIGGIYWYSHANHQTDRPGVAVVSLVGAD